MDFQEAEARFRSLEEQRAAHRLGEEAYRAELNRLRVTDGQGRLWMMQEKTGQWHVYEGGRWVPATPPRPAAATPAPPPAPPPPPAAAVSTPKGGGCGRILLRLIGWAVLWTAIAIVLYNVIGRDVPVVLVGVALAAFISLVSYLVSISRPWEGVIVDLKTEVVRVQQGNVQRYGQAKFAYVRTSDGRTRKLVAKPKWQAGDRLEKRRGETGIRHIPG